MKNWNFLKKFAFFSCYGITFVGILGMFLIDRKITKSCVETIYSQVLSLKDNAKLLYLKIKRNFK